MDSLSKRMRIAMIVVVTIAFSVRVAATFYWQHTLNRDQQVLRFGDSHSYWTMAGHIARGMPYQYGSDESKIFRAPLYPLFIAPWTLLSDHGPSNTAVLCARLMGVLLGCATVALIMWGTRRLAGDIAAILAGLCAAFYPGAIGMSIFVLSESISTPAIVLCIVIAGTYGVTSPHRWQWGICAGVAFAAACLARPSWSLLPAFLFPYLLLTWNRRLSIPKLSQCSFGIFFVLAVLVTMSPWWIRNYSITGKFVPTTLQVGASLYDGWHPQASGSSDENMDFVLPFIIEQKAEDEMLAKQGIALESTLEWRIDRRMRNAAISWAYKNPSDVISLGLVKLRKMWFPLPLARELSNPWIRWSEAIGYVFIVGWSLVGVVRYRHLRGAWLYVVPCLYLAVLHSVFIGSVRYRQPGVLLLCPLAGAGCAVAIEWIRVAVHGTRIDRQNEKAV